MEPVAMAPYNLGPLGCHREWVRSTLVWRKLVNQNTSASTRPQQIQFDTNVQTNKQNITRTECEATAKTVDLKRNGRAQCTEPKNKKTRKRCIEHTNYNKPSVRQQEHASDKPSPTTNATSQNNTIRNKAKNSNTHKRT